MSYRFTKKDGNERTDVAELVASTIAEAPTTLATGSICYAFDEKKFYIFNFEKEWVEL